MTATKDLNRGTGLLIIEVRQSNPNGDPDAESDPRVIDSSGLGLISPVSFKRKIRDLVADADGPAMTIKGAKTSAGGHKFGILETRGRDRVAIGKMNAQDFKAEYWDGRVFGNTFLEEKEGKKREKEQADKSLEGQEGKNRYKDHFIATGVVQFGAGVSVAPVEIIRLTTTNKAGVEGDKDRGMAPLGWRVVEHALYTMPFFVNPSIARKTGCSVADIELLKAMIPLAYRSTASAMRPFVEIRHAWYAEHKSPLGSCPDHRIIDALTPRKKGDPNVSSRSIADYEVPAGLPDDVLQRLNSFVDLADV